MGGRYVDQASQPGKHDTEGQSGNSGHRLRDAITAQRFAAWQTDFTARYAEGDLEPF